MREYPRRNGKFSIGSRPRGPEIVYINNYNAEKSQELPQIITTHPPLRVLIDSGATSSIINPKVAQQFFSNYIYSYQFTVVSVHEKTKGTHDMRFPILSQFGKETPITLLVTEWHSTYDCLLGSKDLKALQAKIDYKNDLLSTPRFEINFITNEQINYSYEAVNKHIVSTKNTPNHKNKITHGGKKLPESKKIPLNIRTDHMNEKEKTKIIQLCKKYSECFYDEQEKLTATNAITHKIPTTNEKPMYVKSFRYPYHLRKEIQNQIQKLLKSNIIRPSTSPYSSPVWIVPKKSDASGLKKWRMVIDYRKLNDITVDDKYPLPRMEDILENLGKCTYF
ncbi:hypothetical protein TKK_0009873 [Trichogramma kaykai]